MHLKYPPGDCLTPHAQQSLHLLRTTSRTAALDSFSFGFVIKLLRFARSTGRTKAVTKVYELKTALGVYRKAARVMCGLDKGIT